MCAVLSCVTFASASVVGAVEEEEEEEEEEDGSGGSEELTELVGDGLDEAEVGEGTMVGALREAQLIRSCPTSPIRARKFRWHRGHVGIVCASASRTRRICDFRASRLTLAAAMRLAS
ncbi:hypothetical protein SprV_0100465100 [Sparganum proliferum]